MGPVPDIGMPLRLAPGTNAYPFSIFSSKEVGFTVDGFFLSLQCYYLGVQSAVSAIFNTSVAKLYYRNSHLLEAHRRTGTRQSFNSHLS